MSSVRDRITQAIQKNAQRELKAQSKKESTRKRGKPEKTVEASCLLWIKAQGFDVDVVEASSYDPILRKKGSSKTTAGFSDLVGNDTDGLALFIELKAKDRRSTLSQLQRIFLIKKIKLNCFAVVVDSHEKLAQYYSGFKALKTKELRQAYLLDCLPKPRQKKPKDTFEERFGF